MWDRLAPFLIERLRKPPKNISMLRYMLKIIQGSSLDEADIVKISSQKAKLTKNHNSAPIWFAAWAGVEPQVAIPALSARLAETASIDKQTQFAMLFITELLGGRRGGGNLRQVYRKVEHMKELYLLMHKYVRQAEDIDRANTGVYSPELRDDAQDAREALFNFIRETPGKESFLALMEISRTHPSESHRPWMAFHAKAKATLDADTSAWSTSQVREFNDKLDRTPENHRELWYLAVDLLHDLKYDLEDGDSSVANILKPVNQETQIRNYIGSWCRDRSNGKFNIPQEEELADAKRPDLRFLGVGFDGPVPVELKLADKWTGPQLFERLENQLCGDYLRDRRSNRGVFLLVYHGKKTSWDLPTGNSAEGFQALVDALQNYWSILALQLPSVEDIKIIGIDLTKRSTNSKSSTKSTGQKKPRESAPKASH
ncbi:hypothetical protein D9M70_364120 [compost metagenome]